MSEEIYQECQEALMFWEKSEHLYAFEVWGRLYKKEPEVFTSYKPIVNLIREKQRQSFEDKLFEADIIELVTKYQANTLQTELAHQAFSKFLFSIGLLPQHWFEYVDLKSSLTLWKKEANSQPFFPYNGYILGILYCYNGLFTEAESILQKAFDHIPSSKQKALKIEELIRLCKIIIGEPKKKTLVDETFSEQDWISLGFNEDLEAWRASGLSPELARLWRDKSFSAKQATRWHKGEFELEQALIWREALTDDPVFATQCKVAGFDDPLVAANWMKIFTFPSEAMRWIEQGFSSKDAALWMRQGVTDPAEAKKRKMH